MKILAWPAFINRKDNPYNYNLYSHMQFQGNTVYEWNIKNIILEKFDVLHLHWPDNLIVKRGLSRYFKTVLFFFSLTLMKAKGTKIVWTAHNIFPHKYSVSYRGKFFYYLLSKYIDGLILLSYSSEKEFHRNHSWAINKKSRVIYHGEYDRPSEKIDKEDARKILGLENSLVLLFMGKVDSYKGLTCLIRAFRGMKNAEWKLVIAGSVAEEYTTELLNEISLSEDVILFDRYIEEEEMKTFFAACDIVVLPYIKILNSGSLFLSLSYSKPVIAPNKGSITEMRDLNLKDWIYTYEDKINEYKLAEKIECVLREKRASDPDMHLFSWARISNQHANFFEELSK